MFNYLKKTLKSLLEIKKKKMWQKAFKWKQLQNLINSQNFVIELKIKKRGIQNSKSVFGEKKKK